MDMILMFKWTCLCVLGILPTISEALTCYQCNVFIRGSPWTCESERTTRKERGGCLSCLKTYTRTYLQNTFHDDTYTTQVSKLCVLAEDYTRADGCYSYETASGYQTRCFCSDADRCNGVTRNGVTLATSILTFCASFTLNLLLFS